MPPNPLHFATLNAAPAPAIWLGQPPQIWAAYITAHALVPPAPQLIALLPVAPLNRPGLHAFCAANVGNLELCVLACWAWGGMHRMHAVRAWDSRAGWLPVVQNLVHGAYATRADAFDAFAACYNAGSMPGMRAAYFTKLIFFLMPNLDGYIMDQWTARSINLLYDRTSRDLLGQMISLNPGANGAAYVASNNTGATYNDFCLAIEDIALKLGVLPSDAEERLMSNGSNHGRPQGAWRTYVRRFPI